MNTTILDRLLDVTRIATLRSAGELDHSRDTGFDAHLIEPVTLESLEEAIRCMID